MTHKPRESEAQLGVIHILVLRTLLQKVNFDAVTPQGRQGIRKGRKEHLYEIQPIAPFA